MLFLCSCSDGKHDDGTAAGHSAGPEEGGAPPSSSAVTNRIPVPETVRRNLGIRFGRVEYRHVASTIRLPGRFELRPSARREYRSPLAGRIELMVHQYDRVTTGTPLYRLDSAEWRQLQQGLADAEAQVQASSASLTQIRTARIMGREAPMIADQRVTASVRYMESLRQTIEIAEARVQQIERLQTSVGGKLPELAEARYELAQARSALTQAEKEHAELRQQQIVQATEGTSAFSTTASLDAAVHARTAEYEAATLRVQVARATMRSILGVTDAELDTANSEGHPYWRTVDQVEFRAAGPGVVQTVDTTNGAYVEATALVLAIADPESVRFRAVGLQSDIARLSDARGASIVPPPGEEHHPDEKPIPGILSFGMEAHPEERRMDVIVTPTGTAHWAQAGITAFAEVVLDATEDSELAVPVSAVIQDELQKVVFRRDPADPDKVIRMEADLGVSDGRWVSVLSGLGEDDEVVVQGTYQLKLAGSGKLPEGAHVDADGTVHTGKH